jgi:hypothetical protein
MLMKVAVMVEVMVAIKSDFKTISGNSNVIPETT